jgi:uncharacterized membrane protein YdjX (TVP38/TMEM64 family)
MNISTNGPAERRDPLPPEAPKPPEAADQEPLLPGTKTFPHTYRSYRDLPLYTFISGGLIILLGMISLVLMLMKVEGNGLLWLAFYSIPANTAISIFPHEPAIILYGQHYNIILIAVFAAIGNLIAAVLDYYFFTPVLQLQFTAGYKKSRVYRKSIQWFAVAPFWVVVLFALTPLPFYLVKILVFSSGYSAWRFLAGILVGRFPRFILLALLGEAVHIPTWMMIVLFALIFLVYISWAAKAWYHSRRNRQAP